MSAKSKFMSSVLKGYLYRNAARDARKLIRRAQDIDYEKLAKQLELKRLMKMAKGLDLSLDRDRILHRIGLADYEPGKRTLAGFGFFALGALAGGVAALALAPKPGEEIRTEVKDRAMGLFGKASEKAEHLTHSSPMA